MGDLTTNASLIIPHDEEYPNRRGAGGSYVTLAESRIFCIHDISLR